MTIIEELARFLTTSGYCLPSWILGTRWYTTVTWSFYSRP